MLRWDSTSIYLNDFGDVPVRYSYRWISSGDEYCELYGQRGCDFRHHCISIEDIDCCDYDLEIEDFREITEEIKRNFDKYAEQIIEEFEKGIG